MPHNEDGTGGMHLFMPWWGDNKKLDFPRGYHIEIGGGRRMPTAGFRGGIHQFTGIDAAGRPMAFGGYGKQLKQDYRRLYGATVSFAGRGEMIPNKDSYCDIDPSVVDKWGIPVPRFHFKWSDYEINQAKHMQETFRAIIDQMGGTPIGAMPSREQGFGIAAGGRIIHELGVTRMGNDPSTSVLNSHCQAHDVKNVFVADGGPFVTQPDKNCTWTILALSMRTSEYIAEQRNAGTVDSLTDSPARPYERHQSPHVAQLISAAPVAAGFAWTDAEAQTAHQHAQAARATAAEHARPVQAEVLHRARVRRPCGCSST